MIYMLVNINNGYEYYTNSTAISINVLYFFKKKFYTNYIDYIIDHNSCI